MFLAITPARGGSKGIPKKNLTAFRGKPLIAHAIECVKHASCIDAHIVSTDCPEIAEVARRHGGTVPFMRSSELAQDTTPMIAVLRDTLIQYESQTANLVDAIVLVDPTAPLRVPGDLDQAVRMYKESTCDAVISASTAHRNPFFNMVIIQDRECRLVCDSGPKIARRQDAPDVFDLNTVVWVYSRQAVMNEIRIPTNSLIYLVPKERCLDLDTDSDLKLLQAHEK